MSVEEQQDKVLDTSMYAFFGRKQLLAVDYGVVLELFTRATDLEVWAHGGWRCPEGHINIEWDERTKHHEQDYITTFSAPSDDFDDQLADGSWGIIPKEEALDRIKENGATYDHLLSFLVTYGYVEKADVYAVVSGSNW